jgi:hypothetical protein
MVVYWTVYPLPNLPLLNYKEPTSLTNLINDFEYKTENIRDNFKYCPAVKNSSKNTFRLQFPFDYNIELKNDAIVSTFYDQDFFDKMVLVRSVEKKHLSFNLAYLFVCEDDLEIETTSCHFSDNDFTNKTMIVPGRFNIGKWVRPLDCAFFIKNNHTSLSINNGDDYCYIKFNTNETVELKKFYTSSKIIDIVKGNFKSREYKIKLIEKLSYFYDLYEKSKLHKIIINEIKNNLME